MYLGGGWPCGIASVLQAASLISVQQAAIAQGSPKAAAIRAISTLGLWLVHALGGPQRSVSAAAEPSLGQPSATD